MFLTALLFLTAGSTASLCVAQMLQLLSLSYSIHPTCAKVLIFLHTQQSQDLSPTAIPCMASAALLSSIITFTSQVCCTPLLPARTQRMQPQRSSLQHTISSHSSLEFIHCFLLNFELKELVISKVTCARLLIHLFQCFCLSPLLTR